jgi:hypothetical protein
MFETLETAELDGDLRLRSGDRKLAAAVAGLNIGIIWLFFAFGDRPIASGMSFQTVLQGCILLSVPYLVILIATLVKADRLVGLISASLASLGLTIFPLLAFVSWLTTYRPGPMALLAPASLALGAPARAAIRELTGKAKFLVWAGTLAIVLGCYFWFSVLVYLGQQYLYVPCPASPCHWNL